MLELNMNNTKRNLKNNKIKDFETKIDMLRENGFPYDMERFY